MKKLASVLFVFILSSSLQLMAQNQKGQDIDGEDTSDNSGWSVSMPDANTVAIGAPNNNGNGSDAGHVRILSWNGNAWIQKGLDIDGEEYYDRSGHSISMPDPNTVAIGAPKNTGIDGYAGHVRVYSWDGTNWLQRGQDIDGQGHNFQSGSSVSMPNANIIAIGAPKANVTSNGNLFSAGNVRVFSWDSSSWAQKGLDIEGETGNERSGYSVSMPDANTVGIGVKHNEVSIGTVRVFYWNESIWIQKGNSIDGETMGELSGHSVSMPDNNTIAIGSFGNFTPDGSVGRVRIFRWDGLSWIQKGTNIDGEAVNDHSGWSVSMPDAKTVAIGAQDNDGNGTNTGHVRIYSWDGVTWIQKGMDIDGEESFDYSGYAVSMPDSSTVAIGAINNSGSATFSGHVRVYSFCSIADFSVAISGAILTTNIENATYQWVDCDNNNDPILGEIGQSFTANTSGNYAVIVTQNGCTNISACENINSVGIDEKPNNEIRIYPNPTKGIFTIDLGAKETIVNIRLKSADGKLITEQLNVYSQQIIIDLSENSNGVYFLTIQGIENFRTIKLIKN